VARAGEPGDVTAAAQGNASGPAVRDLVGALIGERGLVLVVSDFDGTLSPIVREPMGARIVPAAQAALRRLARIAEGRPERLAVVVLSGRAALDVAGRVRVGGVAYHGNHGIERGELPRRARPERLEVVAEAALAPFVDRAHALGVGVARVLGHPSWLFVEDKGPTVAFHFRQAPEPERARAAVLEAIESVENEIGEHGLVAFEGRKVVEFRPIGAGGKGAAVERLIEGERPAAVLMLGDDKSDAEGFESIRRARAAGMVRGLAVAVHGAAETPAEVAAAADLELPDPVAAARLLGALAGLLEREGRA
jgi:trehalose 6-phosphate phosphatase